MFFLQVGMELDQYDCPLVPVDPLIPQPPRLVAGDLGKQSKIL